MTPRARLRPSSGDRRGTRQRAEGGRRFAIAVFVLSAMVAVLAAGLWGDPRQGLVALGFLAGAALMLVRPVIESRRRLGFAVPPGGAERLVTVLACGASVGLIRLAQVTAGTDNPPVYLLTAFLCWALSLGAAWSASSLPLGERR